MPDDFDITLLESWRGHRDRPAMDRLIRHHIHFVYGAARRILRDATLAEDVTQAVFMLLIQKSPRVPSDAALAVWLHRTTRYACANARKLKVRREQREQMWPQVEQISMENQIDNIDEREHLSPLLDEAINQLGPRDRSGLILCYFQKRTFREIGALLGTTEEAARKRVTRSVDRIREYFDARGVSTASSAVVACMVHQTVVTAPAALVSATTNLATVSQIAALVAVGTYPSAQIAQRVMHTMFMWKMKLAAAACAAIVAGGAVTATAIQHMGTSAAPTVAMSSVLASAPFEAQVSDATQVQFLGVAKWGATADEWFAIDGSKVEDPRGPFASENLRARPGVTHQAMLLISGHELAGGYSVQVPQASSANMYDLTPDDNRAFLLIPFTVPPERAGVDIELLIADGEWKTIVTAENRPGNSLGNHETEAGGVALTHITEGERGGSVVYLAHEVKSQQVDVVAIDPQGNERRTQNYYGGQVGGFNAIRCEFDLPPDQITALVVKVRPFNKRVTARNVTLDPAKPTKPVIEVKDLTAGK
ncbi:hypothetical protein BH09PLA1_BH09PLA1_01890 [soil metagenome]